MFKKLICKIFGHDTEWLDFQNRGISSPWNCRSCGEQNPGVVWPDPSPMPPVKLHIPCICEGNWRNIVHETVYLLDRKFIDHTGKEFYFFGIVHGSDDYYYGMSDNDHKIMLLSCVASIEDHGYKLVKTLEEDNNNVKMD